MPSVGQTGLIAFTEFQQIWPKVNKKTEICWTNLVMRSLAFGQFQKGGVCTRASQWHWPGVEGAVTDHWTTGMAGWRWDGPAGHRNIPNTRQVGHKKSG